MWQRKKTIFFIHTCKVYAFNSIQIQISYENDFEFRNKCRISLIFTAKILHKPLNFYFQNTCPTTIFIKLLEI